MDISSAQPSLRLVRPDDQAAGLSPAPARPGSVRSAGVEPAPGRMVYATSRGSPAASAERVREVERENASAASLPALDPRWILAVQVSREMQGGRAAVVTPEGRKRLMLVGRRLGLRAFDTSLVIAVVQDGARRGEDPLGREANSRLRLVGAEPEMADVRPGLSWGQVAVLVIAAGVFGAAVAVMMMRVVG